MTSADSAMSSAVARPSWAVRASQACSAAAALGLLAGLVREPGGLGGLLGGLVRGLLGEDGRPGEGGLVGRGRLGLAVEPRGLRGGVGGQRRGQLRRGPRLVRLLGRRRVGRGLLVGGRARVVRAASPPPGP